LTAVGRGSLWPGSSAPLRGEFERHLTTAHGLAIRQVLSGELDRPIEYLQDTDEWALVMSGSASLVVDGEMLELEAGDWVWLPAGTPHRLVRTEPGTSWVTVHLDR
jgi:mannose-6-phosphate isomerase-like protein (cupin superfamily)